MTKYTVTVRTGTNSSNESVFLTIKGTKGETESLELDNVPLNDFESEKTDVFQLDTIDVGEISEVIVGFSDEVSWINWSFEWIKVQNHDLPKDKQTYLFTNGELALRSKRQTSNFHINYPNLDLDAQYEVTLKPTRAFTIRRLLRTTLNTRLSINVRMNMADVDYFFPPLDYAMDILERTRIDRFKWVEERFDCDDFALELKSCFVEDARKSDMIPDAHAFGIVWANLKSGGGHAINWMVNEDHILRFIEPQNDHVFLPDSPEGLNFHHCYFFLA